MQTLTRRRLLANTTAAALLSPSLARAARWRPMQDRPRAFWASSQRKSGTLPAFPLADAHGSDGII
jgi:hypothetical protein